jgi:hypothetical protein
LVTRALIPQICRVEPRLNLVQRGPGRWCVVWKEEPFPPGSDPRHGRIGVEIDQRGEALLLVQEGVGCAAGDDEVHGWFQSGTFAFSSLENMFRWVDARLTPLYAQAPIAHNRAPGQSTRPPGELTNLDES